MATMGRLLDSTFFEACLASPDATMVFALVADDLECSFANLVAERWLGDSSSPLKGRNVTKGLAHTPLHGLLPAALQVVTTRVAHTTDVTFRGRTHKVTVLPLGEGVLVTSVDVTRFEERAKKREEQTRARLIEPMLAVDDSLATIAHELRTPLASILGWAHILVGEHDEATTEKGLRVIERNARSQARLIDDLLDMSRIARGQLRIDAEDVELEGLAKDILDALRPTAAAKAIQLVLVVESRPCRLVGDGERLRQVLWNLVANAIKFTPAKGKVVLTLGNTASAVVLSVRDDGHGIEKEFLPHVFERFRQGDGSTTRAYGGVGLGLAIVRHLVEMHGGTVSAESDGPGKGATFKVSLPVRRSGEHQLGDLRDPSPVTRPEGLAARHPPAPRLSSLRILAVEDQDDAREIIELALVREGARVKGVASADDALRLLRDFEPDVLVSDIAMPGHDGYWLMNQVRTRYPSVRAIALSGCVRSEDIARAGAAGFARHLAKPVDTERLVEAVREVAPPGQNSA